MIKKSFIIVFLGLLVSFSSKKNEPQHIIYFKVYSDSLSKENYDRIVSFGKDFNKMIIESTNSPNMSYIQLRNYTCSFELNKNPLIGYLRAKKMTDILEKECNISRTKVQYVDIAGREFQMFGEETCKNMKETGNVGIKMEIH